jgi:hypothetical protein
MPVLSFRFNEFKGETSMDQPKLSPHAQQMHHLIREYLSSGLTQRTFYQQKHLPRSTFHYWLNHYRKHNGVSEKTKKPRFIPLFIKENSKGCSSAVSISFANGVTVQFDEPVSTQTLLTLINSGNH